MNRRSILKGLLALPFAPLVAKAATKALPTGHRVTCLSALPKLSMMPGDPFYTAQYKNMTRIVNPPMTAMSSAEIQARMEERMLDLQPVLERLNKQSWNTNWRDVSRYILPEIK